MKGMLNDILLISSEKLQPTYHTDYRYLDFGLSMNAVIWPLNLEIDIEDWTKN